MQSSFDSLVENRILFVRSNNYRNNTIRMEAIKSVENEVDKVLRLFSDCRDKCTNTIDQLIDIVEKSKQEMIKLTERKYNMGGKNK